MKNAAIITLFSIFLAVFGNSANAHQFTFNPVSPVTGESWVNVTEVFGASTVVPDELYIHGFGEDILMNVTFYESYVWISHLGYSQAFYMKSHAKNRIHIYTNHGNDAVTVNDYNNSFEDMTIIFSGGEGDDFFSNNTDFITFADGDEGNDTLLGGDNADFLMGGLGDDDLNGRDGLDTVWGEEGDDILEGGYDGLEDDLQGGRGKDTFNANYERSGYRFDWRLRRTVRYFYTVETDMTLDCNPTKELDKICDVDVTP